MTKVKLGLKGLRGNLSLSQNSGLEKNIHEKYVLHRILCGDST